VCTAAAHTPAHSVMRPEIRLALALVAGCLCPASIAGNCAFHCNTLVSSCGGNTSIAVVQHSFNMGTELFCEEVKGSMFTGICVDAHNSTKGGSRMFTTPQAVLDLRNRGITSVLSGGFDCWRHRFESMVVVGVLLDDNPLEYIVNGTDAGLNVASFVSYRNCSIRSVRGHDLVTYGRPTWLEYMPL
jgi:hypothetical protein